nr:allantoinase AllB [Labedaea rhizosphaerae]
MFRARRAVVDDVERACSVVVRDGRIAAVEDYGEPGPDDIALGDDVVLLPGLVDTHVHVNEPGRTEWEGFATATRAAAAGGVTTLLDMPLNSIPPTTDVAALQAKQAAARDQVHVDVGFWGGAVPGNAADLPRLHAAGVFGFKCFTLHSGVDEFGCLDDAGLDQALEVIAGFGGTLIVHAEDAGSIGAPHGLRYADFVASRPPAAETTAIARVLEAAEKARARVHILHLSTADGLALIAEGRRRGVQVTAETCPHYLCLAAEDVPDGATRFKCCPPIRDKSNQDRLWAGLRDGVVDCVVSDHSPATRELKNTGDFGTAWGGIAGVQVGLSAMWTQATARGIPLADVVRWMARRPAELVGLRHKGRIAPGFDADLCVFDPDAEFTVDAARLHHRNPVTAYDGLALRGLVRSTWLRGDEVTGDHPRGRLLTREDR